MLVSRENQRKTFARGPALSRNSFQRARMQRDRTEMRDGAGARAGSEMKNAPPKRRGAMSD
jgi:hypothetical protein